MTVPGVNADHRGDVHGRRSATSAASPSRASWSATSASTRGCASRAPARPRTAASQSRARPPARHALVEAAWSVVRQPGPLRAFYQRIRARRGHQVAIVAAARKLACLFWCLLTREEDYAYAQPSLTDKKMRRLELTAGAPQRQGQAGDLGRQHGHAPGRTRTRTPRPSSPTGAPSPTGRPTAKAGAGATPGRASQGRQSGKQRGRPQAPDVCALARRHPRPPKLSQGAAQESSRT